MLLKKLIIILTILISFTICTHAVDAPDVSARSAVLINAETKEIIYQKNAFDKRSMASTTKIMTGLLAVESGRLSETVTVGNIQSEGSSIGLKKGYKLTLEALTYGMMLESGNDAAVVCAEFLGGSEEAFSVLMNKKAKEIGMLDTNFVTASGLDSKEHYSTAYDMALLGAKAVSNPIFRKICSSKTKRVAFIEPEISVTFSNHNKLLSWCEGVFGIKTGFTKKSGRCLVSACERDGTTLVAVTLSVGDDWNDHRKLYDYGFEKCVSSEVYIRLPEGVRVYSGYGNGVNIGLECNPVRISFADSDRITQKVYLPEFVYAPVKCGDILGRAELYRDNKIICSYNILAKSDIASIPPLPEKKSIWSKITEKLSEIFT